MHPSYLKCFRLFFFSFLYSNVPLRLEKVLTSQWWWKPAVLTAAVDSLTNKINQMNTYRCSNVVYHLYVSIIVKPCEKKTIHNKLKNLHSHISCIGVNKNLSVHVEWKRRRVRLWVPYPSKNSSTNKYEYLLLVALTTVIMTDVILSDWLTSLTILQMTDITVQMNGVECVL